ncbi:MAG: MFS transporter [Anaerolineales bacterium]
MKRVNLLNLLVLNAYWFGLSFMWNSLHVIILPAVLLNFVPESLKNTYLGLMTFLGLIIAMLVQPVSGWLSDKWRSSWGRRRPLISLGTLLDFIFLAFLAWAGGLPMLAIGYIGLQFTSNIAHGPAQGLLPDQVPQEKLGAGSGIKNLMDMAGLVVSSLLMGRLLDPLTADPLKPVLVVAITLLIGASITIFGVRERSSLDDTPGDRRRTQTSSFTALFAGVKSALEYRPYAWLIGSRFLFLLGIYDIQVFAQYFIRDVIQTDNPVKLTGDLLASITLALIACALGAGWLGDRFGHRKVQYIASAIGTLGCLLLLLARTPQTLLVFGGVVGVGIGLFLTANWALVNRLAPLAEAGVFLGLTNLATAGSGAVGRLLGPFIDLMNNAQPGAYMGYTVMFVFGAICTGASSLLLSRTRES